MLSTLRHKGVSRKVLWAVTIIIVLSFGVFGTAAYRDNTIGSAGKIFGKSVPLRDFEKAYLDSRDQAILMYGDRFFKLGQNLDLEREAWTRLMLMHEAKKSNIKVEDKDVVEFIASIPFFQKEGKFDQKIYESIVANPSVFDRRTKDFEDGIRGSLIVRKLLDQVAGPTVITEEDLKKEYIRRNEKIKLSYVLFSPSDYSKGLTASDEEAKTFFEAHKESFREPPMVNVHYVHLLYPDKATDVQKQSVKKNAIDISHDLNPKADFAAIAQKHHTTAKESGFFSHDQPLLTFAWSPEFVDKIFAMKLNDVSDPMESPDGWQIVKIKEKKDSTIPDLAGINAKIKDAVIAQKALDAATAQAETILKTIQTEIKTGAFKTIADKLTLKIEETTSFSRGEYINAPGLIAEFQQESLELNDTNKLSGIVSTSQGPAILYLNSTEKIDDKKFAEDKEDFRQMMTAQRRNQAIATYQNKIKLEASLKTDLKGKIRYR